MQPAKCPLHRTRLDRGKLVWDASEIRLHCKQGRPLTRRKGTVSGNDILIPAFARHQGQIQFSNGRALHPVEERAETQKDVDGNDNEPDKTALPTVGEAKQQDCERCFAPSGRNNRTDACYVGY